MIAELVRRDLPFYDARISATAADSLVGFCRRMGILSQDLAYADLVAIKFQDLWSR
jgi:NitT/TauT family transport system substrate-binding protein